MIEYEIKRNDISVKICVDVYFVYRTIQYTIADVLTKQKRKRKWDSVSSSVRDRWEYRQLDIDKRCEYAKKEFLKYVTEDELNSALQFAYDSVKPTPQNTVFRVF